MAKRKIKNDWNCIYNKDAMHRINKTPKEGDVIEGKKIEKIEVKSDYYLIKWYENV